MKHYIARRLTLAIPTLVGVSFIIFIIMSVIPGDATYARVGEGATAEDVLIIREQLGLNDPWYQRYGRWVRNILTFGDLGESVSRAGVPIRDLIAEHFPVTLNLSIYTTIVAVSLGVPMGIVSAMRHNTWLDYFLRVFSIIGLSVPVFWLGVLIVLAQVTWFNWSPQLRWVSPFDSFWVNLKQMVWPAITLGYFQVAFIARMTRSSLLEVLREDYMRTAKAKGLSETTVTVRHGLRNAIISVLTVAGLQFIALLGGVVVTEKVFNLAGLGTLLVTGVFNRDFALVQTLVFIFAALIIVANLITDLSYAWLDPRIRYQ